MATTNAHEVLRITWREPGSMDHGPRDFWATGRPGHWDAIFSQYASEFRGVPEEVTDDLRRRADEEYTKRSNASKGERAEAGRPSAPRPNGQAYAVVI